LGFLIDLAFAFDIGFNFLTTFVNEKTGKEVEAYNIIAKNYVYHWRFWVDILSTVPFELFYNFFTTSDPKFQFSLFELLKLIRLLRLGRIISYLKVK
jgi:Ion transport protein